jgi:hypothetical protein
LHWWTILHKPTPSSPSRSGVGPDSTDRTKWSVQAQRIYEQAVSLIIANRDQAIRLRRQ